MEAAKKKTVSAKPENPDALRPGKWARIKAFPSRSIMIKECYQKGIEGPLYFRCFWVADGGLYQEAEFPIWMVEPSQPPTANGPN